MDVRYIIMILSILFWLFPAFRQYRTNLFGYFLILAISDPLSIALGYATILEVHNFYAVFGFIFLLVLYIPYQKRWYIRVILCVSLLFLILSFCSSVMFVFETITLFHALVFLFFFLRAIYFIAESSKVNVFHIFLILYETSIILKLLAVLTEAKTGAVFFYATSIFQIFIAIFFSIYKEDNNRLLIDMRNI